MTKYKWLTGGVLALSLLVGASDALAQNVNEAAQPVDESSGADEPSGATFPTIAAKGPDVLSRGELHRWQRHIRGFRREHNFSMTTGLSSGTWEVKHFGNLENRKFAGSGVLGKFRYSFHLPIYKGFGYFLGSSVGYHYESADSRSPFKPVPSLMFPGIMVGLVQNFSPVLRISSAFEIYLERHEDIAERDRQGEDPEISVTMQAYDAAVFFDIFYDLDWALRIESHIRLVDFYPPASSAGHPVDARIRKSDAWLGVGLVYHLL